MEDRADGSGPHFIVGRRTGPSLTFGSRRQRGGLSCCFLKLGECLDFEVLQSASTDGGVHWVPRAGLGRGAEVAGLTQSLPLWGLAGQGDGQESRRLFRGQTDKEVSLIPCGGKRGTRN